MSRKLFPCTSKLLTQLCFQLAEQLIVLGCLALIRYSLVFKEGKFTTLLEAGVSYYLFVYKHPSVTAPVKSISSLGSQSTKTSLGWFIFHWLFLSSCISHKKGREWQALIFTGMKTLNTFYILVLWLEELVNDLHFFTQDWLTVPSEQRNTLVL